MFFYTFAEISDAVAKAKERYEVVTSSGENRMVSGSDDTCLILWNPDAQKPQVGKDSVQFSQQ